MARSAGRGRVLHRPGNVDRAGARLGIRAARRAARSGGAAVRGEAGGHRHRFTGVARLGTRGGEIAHLGGGRRGGGRRDRGRRSRARRARRGGDGDRAARLGRRTHVTRAERALRRTARRPDRRRGRGRRSRGVRVRASVPLLPQGGVGAVRQRLRAARFPARRPRDALGLASPRLMAVVTWRLGRSALVDLPTVTLGGVSGVLLRRYRINSAWLVLAGAAVGILTSL